MSVVNIDCVRSMADKSLSTDESLSDSTLACDSQSLLPPAPAPAPAPAAEVLAAAGTSGLPRAVDGTRIRSRAFEKACC